jgi:hypothetical protein
MSAAHHYPTDMTMSNRIYSTLYCQREPDALGGVDDRRCVICGVSSMGFCPSIRRIAKFPRSLATGAPSMVISSVGGMQGCGHG